MNCHGNNENNGNNNNKGHGHGHDGRKKGPMSHMFMMAICCGAPIILILLIPLLKNAGLGTGANGFLSILAFAACPIMMMVMMPMMMKGHKNKEDNQNHTHDVSIEKNKIREIEEKTE